MRAFEPKKWLRWPDLPISQAPHFQSAEAVTIHSQLCTGSSMLLRRLAAATGQKIFRLAKTLGGQVSIESSFLSEAGQDAMRFSTSAATK